MFQIFIGQMTCALVYKVSNLLKQEYVLEITLSFPQILHPYATAFKTQSFDLFSKPGQTFCVL